MITGTFTVHLPAHHVTINAGDQSLCLAPLVLTGGAVRDNTARYIVKFKSNTAGELVDITDDETGGKTTASISVSSGSNPTSTLSLDPKAHTLRITMAGVTTTIPAYNTISGANRNDENTFDIAVVTTQSGDLVEIRAYGDQQKSDAISGVQKAHRSTSIAAYYEARNNAHKGLK